MLERNSAEYYVWGKNLAYSEFSVQVQAARLLQWQVATVQSFHLNITTMPTERPLAIYLWLAHC